VDGALVGAGRQSEDFGSWVFFFLKKIKILFRLIIIIIIIIIIFLLLIFLFFYNFVKK
jgi:hypothetical protein